MTTLGGTSYAWDSAFIVGLGIAAVVALIAFIAVERRAAEPVLPPELFRNRVFVVTSAIGLVVGFALFGALTYLPLFQQVVRGATPTESGLQLVPVMAGVLIASIASGQIISRTGRYKAWPIAGTAIACAGMFALSTMDAATSTAAAAGFMFVLGLGLGMVMQVLVLAVQNAVPYEQLGVATSGATLFRSIGGSVGTAILGSIFTNRLDDILSAERSAGRCRRARPVGARSASARGPRDVHRCVHRRARPRVPRRRLHHRRRVPAHVAAGGAAAAHDRRHRRCARGVRGAGGPGLGPHRRGRAEPRRRPRGRARVRPAGHRAGGTRGHRPRELGAGAYGE